MTLISIEHIDKYVKNEKKRMKLKEHVRISEVHFQKNHLGHSQAC